MLFIQESQVIDLRGNRTLHFSKQAAQNHGNLQISTL